MGLRVGTRLGPHEILAPLGTGGMGEVYRARDTRLDRVVAIKVLRAHVAADPDRRQRFEREARLISQLNHPHICTLFDVGHHDPSTGSEQAVDYLVMEYLEGQTLAERLGRSQDRPLPVPEALTIAIQIADALDAAHRTGIVHRDLKPANVMLTKAGAKLLDFGIAKLAAPPHPSSDVPAGVTPPSPTAAATMPPTLTVAGTLLGTIQYMSPEQLEGHDADARSDLFAFGTVLFEMVAGRLPFAGASQASVIAAILEQDPPPISTLQPLTPPALDHVIKKCLAKDPEARWQTARDLVDELKWIAAGVRAPSVAPVATSRRRSAAVAWLIATIAVVAAVVISALAFRPPTPELPVTRLDVNTPPTSSQTSFALSPDGLQLVFVATADGKSKLWIRPLGRMDARPLDGTEGATFPFWKPDSRALAFFADGKLKSLDVARGGLQTLADAPDGGAGGTWNRDGVILFAPADAGRGLLRVAETGGPTTAVTRLEAGAWNHVFPAFLPDGRRFIFFLRNTPDLQGVYLGSLDAPDTQRLMEAETAAAYAPPGYLIVVREGVLVAIPFDPAGGKLVGEPIPVAQGVGSDLLLYRGAFSVSATGLLAHRGVGTIRQLVWFNRDGTERGPLFGPDEHRLLIPQLAPDGQRVAVARTLEGNSDIWLIDTRGVANRLTTDPANEGGQVWSPSGRSLMFGSNRNGRYDLFEKLASGAEQLVFSSPDDKIPEDWSPDGRYFLYTSRDAKMGISHLNALSLSPDGTWKPLDMSQASHSECCGQFSPDGRWIAYRSDKTDKAEIYVRRFPERGREYLVSTSGGRQARWRRDGKELFYIAPNETLMVVPIGFLSEGQMLDVGAPVPLFPTRLAAGGLSPQYAVTPDGQRFLMSVVVDDATGPAITIVQNWTADLRK